MVLATGRILEAVQRCRRQRARQLEDPVHCGVQIGKIDQERSGRACRQDYLGVPRMAFLGDKARNMRQQGRHHYLACVGLAVGEKATPRSKGCVGRDPFALDRAFIVIAGCALSVSKAQPAPASQPMRSMTTSTRCSQD
jgi:hypothetical protein